MTCAETLPFVGVDWGTTHRRAYVLDAAGDCVESYADDDGALACQGRFGPAFAAVVQALKVQPSRVVMSGMVGSAMGWQEVRYLDPSVALYELPAHLARVKDSSSAVAAAIVPGYCVRDQFNQPDVMRGEETQLLGAWSLGHLSGWFLLPGTHCKWVEIKDGRIVQLRTYMTGELFSLLRQYGTLAAAAGSQAGQPAWSPSAFAEGVHAARHGTLSHLLFSARSRVVCGDMPAASASAYLSGLLIGSELHDVMRDSTVASASATFKLIGSPELARHYQEAADLLGLKFELINAQVAYIAALAYLQRKCT
jgi:2-dehydro-3-deoxygalactonokinase